MERVGGGEGLRYRIGGGSWRSWDWDGGGVIGDVQRLGRRGAEGEGGGAPQRGGGRIQWGRRGGQRDWV